MPRRAVWSSSPLQQQGTGDCRNVFVFSPRKAGNTWYRFRDVRANSVTLFYVPSFWKLFFICSLRLNIQYMFYKLKIMSTAKQQSLDRLNDQLHHSPRVFFECKEEQNNQIYEEWICICFYYNTGVNVFDQFHRKAGKQTANMEQTTIHVPQGPGSPRMLLPESVSNLAWKWNSRLVKLARIWNKTPRYFMLFWSASWVQVVGFHCLITELTYYLCIKALMDVGNWIYSESVP